MKTVKSETYISVDIEASGPIPGEYSMLSLGACVVGNTKKNFYVELKSINENYIQRALEVSKLSMKALNENGVTPQEAMKNFETWIRTKVWLMSKPCFSALGLLSWH